MINSEITYKDHDHVKIRWDREDRDLPETGELNFHWEDAQWTLDSEMLGMDSVIDIIKALPDDKEGS